MTPREMIADLLRELSAGEADRLESAVFDADLLLQQTNDYLGYERAVRDQERLATLAPDYVDSRPNRIREKYLEFSDMGWFPEKYVGLTLTTDEIDAVTDALLGLLDHPSAAALAAAALAGCARLYAVPKLAQVLRRDSATRPGVAWNASRALGSILRGRSMGRGRPLTPEEQRLVAQAVAALRFAASHGTKGMMGVRVVAEQELSRLAEHFGPSL